MKSKNINDISTIDLKKMVFELKNQIQLLKLNSDSKEQFKIRFLKKDVARHLTEINRRGNL